jgi:hypothetical protein
MRLPEEITGRPVGEVETAALVPSATLPAKDQAAFVVTPPLYPSARDEREGST